MVLHGRPVCVLLTTLLICMESTGQTQGENASYRPSHTSTNSTRQISTTSNSTGAVVLSATAIQVLLITTLTVAAMGALFNAAVILAIIIDPLKVLRKGAWITILNLAIADLISCVSCICVWGSSTLFPAIINSDLLSAICQFGWGASVSASFLLLTFFTVQIYVITKFPLKSRFIFTDLTILIATLGVWLLAFLLGLLAIANYLHFSYTTCLKLYATRIGVLQLALFIQIILNLQVSMEIMKSGRSAGNDSCQNKKHRNIAKTVIMLTFILFCTAFPFFVFRLIEMFARMGHLSGSTWAVIAYCYAPIAILNFTANPILYSLRLPDYRKTLLTVVGKRKSKGSTPLKTNPTVLSGSSQFSLQRPSSFQRSKSCSGEPSASTPLNAEQQL